MVSSMHPSFDEAKAKFKNKRRWKRLRDGRSSRNIRDTLPNPTNINRSYQFYVAYPIVTVSRWLLRAFTKKVWKPINNSKMLNVALFFLSLLSGQHADSYDSKCIWMELLSKKNARAATPGSYFCISYMSMASGSLTYVPWLLFSIP